MTFALTNRKRVGAICLTALAVVLLAFAPLSTLAQGAPSVDQQNPPAAPQPTPQGESGADAHQVTKDGSAIYTELGYQILSLFAWFTGIAGVLLNAAIYYTVITMADFVNSLGAILTSWKIIRDLGNIALIFGFVAIGIATILDVQSYNAKKMLVKLIIVAVTVNFSLFAARAIIDVGNVFAFQFYSQMINTKEGSQIGTAEVDVTSEGVSNAIMQMVGLQKFYDASTVEKAQRQQLADNSFFAFILGSLLFIIAAFVMFAIAFMLIARFVILVFLMILSPIGFVGLIVPTLEKRAADWWRTLIAQSAVAPIMLLMILVSVNLMTDTDIFGLAGGGSDFKATFQGDSSANDWLGTTNMILGFLISMGFLMASVIVAKQMGAFGASFAIGASRRLVGIALSPISVPARAGGAAAARFGADKGLGLVDKAYNKSGLAAGVRGIGLKALDAKFQHKLDKRNEIKVDGTTLKEEREAVKHREHGLHVEHQTGELKSALAIPDETARMKAVDAAIQKMDGKDVADFVKKAKKDEINAIGKAFSPEKFEDIMKNKDIDSGTKSELQKARFGEYQSMQQDIKDGRLTVEDAQKRVRKLATKDLEQMVKYDADMFGKLLEMDNKDKTSIFSDDQLEALEKSNSLSVNMRGVAKENSRVGRADRWAEAGRIDDAVKLIEQMNSKTKAKLDRKTLTLGRVIDTYTPQDMEELAASRKLSADTTLVRTRLEENQTSTDSTRTKNAEDIATMFADNGFQRSNWGWKQKAPTPPAPGRQPLIAGSRAGNSNRPIR